MQSISVDVFKYGSDSEAVFTTAKRFPLIDQTHKNEFEAVAISP